MTKELKNLKLSELTCPVLAETAFRKDEEQIPVLGFVFWIPAFAGMTSCDYNYYVKQTWKNEIVC